MRKYLEKTGVTVISARTGKSARELLKKRNDISVVLMDIKMPGLNSESFVQDMKREGVNVPIIAQAPAGDDHERVEEILSAGYDELVTKPVTRDELLEKIDRILRQRTKL